MQFQKILDESNWSTRFSIIILIIITIMALASGVTPANHIESASIN